jgi:hypothetical protein
VTVRPHRSGLRGGLVLPDAASANGTAMGEVA